MVKGTETVREAQMAVFVSTMTKSIKFWHDDSAILSYDLIQISKKHSCYMLTKYNNGQ